MKERKLLRIAPFVVMALLFAALIVPDREAQSTQQTRTSIRRATVFNTRDYVDASSGGSYTYKNTPFSELNSFYSGTSWPAADGVITDAIVTLDRPLSSGERVCVEFAQNVDPQRIGPITFGPGEPSTKITTTGWPFDDARAWTVSVSWTNLGSSVRVYFGLNGFDQAD